MDGNKRWKQNRTRDSKQVKTNTTVTAGKNETTKIDMNSEQTFESQQANIFPDIEQSPPTSSQANPQTIVVVDQSKEQQVAQSQAIPDSTVISNSIDSAMDSNQDDEKQLLTTLTKLNTANGGEVYIIGTAHFSVKSVEEVRKVISTIRPTVVVLELCSERAFMLSIDEQSLLEQNRKLSLDKVRSAIAEKGVAQGLIYIMFVKMSANLTENLGMAPGNEFRAGSQEAQKIPGCSIVLGDRSLRVTLARAIASITLWQKIKLIYQVLSSNVNLTQDDIEKFKDKDMLEKLLEDLGGEFPGFKKVILDERNVYLAHSIYQWAQNSVTSNGPAKVVAIVGCGHVKGIVENWGTTKDEDIRKLIEIPEKTKTQIVVSKTIKYCSLALLLYAGYRIFVPSSIQTAIYDKLTEHRE